MYADDFRKIPWLEIQRLELEKQSLRMVERLARKKMLGKRERGHCWNWKPLYKGQGRVCKDHWDQIKQLGIGN